MARDGEKKPRRKIDSYSFAEYIRIPVGLFLIVLSVLSIIKAVNAFQWDAVSVVVSLLVVLAGVVFIGIGATMSVLPFLDRRRR